MCSRIVVIDGTVRFYAMDFEPGTWEPIYGGLEDVAHLVNKRETFVRQGIIAPSDSDVGKISENFVGWNKVGYIPGPIPHLDKVLTANQPPADNPQPSINLFPK